MVESKGWKWEIVEDDKNSIWKNPSVESYYLLNRWKAQNKTEFLDSFRYKRRTTGNF